MRSFHSTPRRDLQVTSGWGESKTPPPLFSAPPESTNVEVMDRMTSEASDERAKIELQPPPPATTRIDQLQHPLVQRDSSLQQRGKSSSLRNSIKATKKKSRASLVLQGPKSPESLSETKKSASDAPKGVRYLYVAQYGNYSSHIRNLLIARPCWSPGPGDPGNSIGKTWLQERRVKVGGDISGLPEINLLWSKYLSKAFLDAMAEGQTGVVVTHNEESKLSLKQAEDSNPQEAPANPPPVRIHNHFEANHVLTAKAGLRETMFSFYTSLKRDPFGAIPLTFVIRQGSEDEEFKKWLAVYNGMTESKGQNMWIVKPGSNSNCGCGIEVCDSVEEVQNIVESKNRSWIVQKYMEMPLLIHKRKFDIRSYCLLMQDAKDGSLQGYFYKEAYLRTTSTEYSLKTKDRFVHLNNDAVQKHGEDYGKFESANKMSLNEFQKYLDEHHPKEGLSVQEKLVPQMRALMADALKASAHKINPRNIQHCFEVFGFDFMVDASFRVWLIEVNTNPCWEPCNTYLGYLIPKMLDEAFVLTLDQIHPEGAIKGKDGKIRGPKDTSWEHIFSPSEANQVSCQWVAALPEGGLELDFSQLGQDILCPPPLKGKHSK